jgi:hypothetical protein
MKLSGGKAGIIYKRIITQHLGFFEAAQHMNRK